MNDVMIDLAVSMHRCPAQGCGRRVARREFMCSPHWKLADSAVQRRVYETWDRGEGAGTLAFEEALDACVRNVNRKLERARQRMLAGRGEL